MYRQFRPEPDSGLALFCGGSAANALVLAAQGIVHNWLAAIESTHRFVSYCLGDLAQIAGISILISLQLTLLLTGALETVMGWLLIAIHRVSLARLGEL